MNSITNCYLISQNGTKYVYNKTYENSKINSGFLFSKNDKIEI